MQTVSEIWNFFQSEILGMAWLNRATGHILGKAGVDTGSRMDAGLQFFIYDAIKMTAGAPENIIRKPAIISPGVLK